MRHISQRTVKSAMTDPRQYAPSAHRNRDLIRDQLAPRWPAAGTVLEIASGSGEHVIHFAASAPHLTFQPTDPAPEARASIDAWVQSDASCRIRPAIDLDVTADAWPVDEASMMICINMIHIAPWAATEGLMCGAERTLRSGGVLWLYGPFIREGMTTAQGNLDFNVWLKEKNPDFGVRRLEDVAELATKNGLGPPDVVEMPANNCLVGFIRG